MKNLASTVLENHTPEQRATNRPMNYIGQADKQRLACQHYLCTSEQALSAPIVVIHGWASDSRIWQKLIPQLRSIASVVQVDLPGFGASDKIEDYSEESLLKLLHQTLPPRCHIMAWSLGGMLATGLALRYPEQVQSLFLLASNAKFVASVDWPSAMAEANFESFYQSYCADSAKTLKQFAGLQVLGDGDARGQLKQLRSLLPEHSANSNWQLALELLAKIDLRSKLKQLSCPSTWLFGESDSLVPSAAAQAIKHLLDDRHRCHILAGHGHALSLDKQGEVFKQAQNFYRGFSASTTSCPEQQAYQLDKQKVAASFSNAANSYDGYAELQRAIGQKLMEKIPLPSEARILDLGCGTGYFSQLIQERCHAKLIGLDLAEGMLRYARSERPGLKQWLCADAEHLPLADNSIDGIFSSLAIQWCQQPEQLFREIKRVLKPGAWARIATLGPETLTELRQSWAEVDDKVHVNKFIDQRHLMAAINAAHFSEQALQQDRQLMQYQHLSELTRELKSLGANNRNAGQSGGLNTRSRLLKLRLAYEQYRGKNGAAAGKLPASYQVFYISLRA